MTRVRHHTDRHQQRSLRSLRARKRRLWCTDRFYLLGLIAAVTVQVMLSLYLEYHGVFLKEVVMVDAGFMTVPVFHSGNYAQLAWCDAS